MIGRWNHMQTVLEIWTSLPPLTGKNWCIIDKNSSMPTVGWWTGCTRHSPWRRSGQIWFSKPLTKIAHHSPHLALNLFPVLLHRILTPTPTLNMITRERKGNGSTRKTKKKKKIFIHHSNRYYMHLFPGMIQDTSRAGSLPSPSPERKVEHPHSRGFGMVGSLRCPLDGFECINISALCVYI